MMKRTGVTRIGPDEPTPLPQSPANVQMQQQPSVSSIHALPQAPQAQILGAAAMLSNASAVTNTAGRGGARAAVNYLKPGALHYAAKPAPTTLVQPQPSGVQAVPPAVRHKPSVVGTARSPPASNPVPVPQPGPGPGPGPVPAAAASPPPFQLQRLKVDDALSYLDQVKYRFHTQPQVYNNFLDIMKDFKSKTIDTPGVITRVSALFKGHPELIVGFNTFLPPGYKIEVQSNGQVSVSMPSPGGVSGPVGGVAGSTPAGGPGTLGPVLLGVAQPQIVQLLPAHQSVGVGVGVGGAIVHSLAAAAAAAAASAAPSNTLHHISQAHQQIEAAQHAGNNDDDLPEGGARRGAAAQPVEFNHAIEYVNKIKSRFSRQPDKYKAFLEILHDYQRGHRSLKPQLKQQMEQEVYSQVAKLFENQDDLLVEFGQFLPDAKAPRHYPRHPHHHPEASPERASPARDPPPSIANHTSQPPPPPPVAAHPLKRSPPHLPLAPALGVPPVKKPRVSIPPAPPLQHSASSIARDVSMAEAAKYATLQEYNFFDRVRKALKNQEVYDNFLRCLLLYTNEVISASEVCGVCAPFLRRHPDLQRWLLAFLHPDRPERPDRGPDRLHDRLHDRTDRNSSRGYNDSSYDSSTNNGGSYSRERLGSDSRSVKYEPIGHLAAQLRNDRPTGDAAMDIDLSTCKRLGTSYCALPKATAEARKCSGRTPLCKEVLNDTWVSFPTWSEDSTFVTSRKTLYAEYIYRCEDERFELDVVIETNAATIRVLEGVAKRLSRLPADEAARLRLDDALGGASTTVHRRAIRTIYGDKAVDIIAGLKKNPAVAVPVVLRRLKAKEEEWREAQKGFNKQWRELNEKYYLKSLDHQGINFKQNDLKALRSKSLFNEIEAAHDAGRPLVVDYGLRGRQEAIKVVREASELLIHHLRRQAGIQKCEKRRLKQLLRRFLPRLLNHPPLPGSDDENEHDDRDDLGSPDSPSDDRADCDKTEVKHEKEPSSESDNGSDKSSKHNRNNKENTPKNNNNSSCKDNKDCKDNPIPHRRTSTKRASSNDESIKSDIKMEDEGSDDDVDRPPNSTRFICTGSWYVFLRLHAVLCARLAGARAAAAAAAAAAARDRAAPLSHAEALAAVTHNLPSSPSQYYPTLLDLVKAVLDGNCEPSAYEDAVREMLGIKAYPLYTLDKVVSHGVRQLQQCASEPRSARCAALQRRSLTSPRGYTRRALHCLRGQPAFKATFTTGHVCRLELSLLDTSDAELASTSPPHSNKPVFLKRNVGRECGANRAKHKTAASRVCRRKRTPQAQRAAHGAGSVFTSGRRRKGAAAAAAAHQRRADRWTVWYEARYKELDY